jgi:Protein of unknown function (DUF3309)
LLSVIAVMFGAETAAGNGHRADSHEARAMCTTVAAPRYGDPPADAHAAKPRDSPRARWPDRLGTGLAASFCMLTLLIILLILAALGGGIGYSRYGYGSWSPLGIIVLIVVVMALMGRL